MTSSLVGSEMCIRDRSTSTPRPGSNPWWSALKTMRACVVETGTAYLCCCLLYTSDAADDM
eukprot:8720182-Prorocentrum_lima.AAC.1